MSSKSVIYCLAATAFVATTALMPTGASAGRGGLQPGTWNWPPYAEGGMPRTTCGYVWVNLSSVPTLIEQSQLVGRNGLGHDDRLLRK